MLRDVRAALGLLSPAARWRWMALLPLCAGSAALEAVGTGAAFALITILGDPARAATLPVASSVVGWLPADRPRTIVLVFTLLVMAFYVVRNAAAAGVALAQERMLNRAVRELSHRLLAAYLGAPYAFHFRRSSADLIRRTSDAVSNVFRGVLGSLLNVVSETLVVAAVVVILGVTAPLVTMAAVVVVGALLLLPLVLSRRASARWGRRVEALDTEVLQTLQHALGGVKEVKVTGRESFFLAQLEQRVAAVARLRSLHVAVNTALRMGVETVFVCGLLFVSLLITLERRGADVLPLLGLYAYAGFRIIPAANRIALYINVMRFSRTWIDHLAADLAQLPAPSPARDDTTPIAFTRAIVFEGVRYAYEGEGEPEPVLVDVDLTIAKGESIAIVGASGAGKSTMVDLLLGLLEPTAGRITVDGRDIRRSVRGWQRHIGYVSQDPFLLHATLRENVAFGVAPTAIDDARIGRALRLAQLADVVASLPAGVNTMLGERGIRLSGGQRQRVAIARALYDEPDVLVFDEATSALDTVTERELIAALDALRGVKTLVVIAHRLTTVRHADRLAVLRDGRVACVGSWETLVARDEGFRAMAGV